jgi:hypothetical protein
MVVVDSRNGNAELCKSPKISNSKQNLSFHKINVASWTTTAWILLVGHVPCPTSDPSKTPTLVFLNELSILVVG